MPGQDIQLAISSSPHLRSQETVPSAMKDVLIALLPVTLVSIYMYRFYAVFLIAVCMISAVLFELLFRKVMKKQATLYDCSALVTGLLLALCLRPGTSWWTAVLAAFFAVGIAKELMGGLGWNRFNPALFGLVAVTLLAPLYVGGQSIICAVTSVLRSPRCDHAGNSISFNKTGSFRAVKPLPNADRFSGRRSRRDFSFGPDYRRSLPAL